MHNGEQDSIMTDMYLSIVPLHNNGEHEYMRFQIKDGSGLAAKILVEIDLTLEEFGKLVSGTKIKVPGEFLIIHSDND